MCIVLDDSVSAATVFARLEHEASQEENSHSIQLVMRRGSHLAFSIAPSRICSANAGHFLTQQLLLSSLQVVQGQWYFIVWLALQIGQLALQYTTSRFVAGVRETCRPKSSAKGQVSSTVTSCVPGIGSRRSTWSGGCREPWPPVEKRGGCNTFSEFRSDKFLRRQ